uniref:Uncharacterized protein n=1 Tax=Triticum urartu TaxID=4572 RepID=A0A8R7QMB1_TRIUA
MTASSSSSAAGDVLPLMPCPDWGGKVISWISSGGAILGSLFYRCVRKDAGLCGFRSTEVYTAVFMNLLAGGRCPVSCVFMLTPQMDIY